MNMLVSKMVFQTILSLSLSNLIFKEATRQTIVTRMICKVLIVKMTMMSKLEIECNNSIENLTRMKSISHLATSRAQRKKEMDRMRAEKEEAYKWLMRKTSS